MKRQLVTAALLGLSGMTPALGQVPPAPLGRWITQSGNLEVEIAPCGSALCGTVVRVLGNRSMHAPDRDMVAADPRPALGMVILSELRDTGEGRYQGRIYDRENGRSYRARIEPAQPDQLLIRGYVGLPLFGQTVIWHRPDVIEAVP